MGAAFLEVYRGLSADLGFVPSLEVSRRDESPCFDGMRSARRPGDAPPSASSTIFFKDLLIHTENQHARTLFSLPPLVFAQLIYSLLYKTDN
jgi:hypothetical protein